MDSRKIKTTKSADGKTTISRNRFGSGYKKESILLNTSTVVDGSTDWEKEVQEISAGHDPDKLIEVIENVIIQFLKDNNLPTKDLKEGVFSFEADARFNFQRLPKLLKEDYAEVIGATQAASCLEEIASCKHHLGKSNYKKGMAHDLLLVFSFQKFTFSILEPTLALGKSHQGGMIGKNTKLTNDEYNQCFKYYESLEKTKGGLRKLGKTEKWEKTKQYAFEKFDVNISIQSLAKTYKN
jgi:hypothetical protein